MRKLTRLLQRPLKNPPLNASRDQWPTALAAAAGAVEASAGVPMPLVPPVVAAGAVVAASALPAVAFFFGQAFLPAFLAGAVVALGTVLAAGAMSFAGAISAAGGAAKAAAAKPEAIKLIAIFFMVIHPFRCQLISHIACTMHTACSLETGSGWIKQMRASITKNAKSLRAFIFSNRQKHALRRKF